MSKKDAECGENLISVERRIGSKGANCAKTLSSFGEDVDYFTVGQNKYDCDSMLESQKINIIRTKTEAEERINIKLVYPEGETSGMIEKNGKMDALSSFEKKSFFDSVINDTDKEELSTYIFTGSLPTNVENTEYLRCLSKLSSLGKYVVLDGVGKLISSQSEFFASLIKPNRDEFTELAENVDILKYFQPPVEKSPYFYTEYLKAGLKYVENFGSEMLLTLGEAGFIYISPNEYIIKEGKPVPLRYPAGMGDNLLSSFLYYRRSLNLNTKEALELAEEYTLKKGMGI